jgi:CheY-like chemotaxis protein
MEMPGMDGLETLVEIRKLYPKLPVIMFSALTERGGTATLDALARDLFLGHTESLFQVDDSFRLVHFPGTTAYWKPTAAQAGGAQK